MDYQAMLAGHRTAKAGTGRCGVDASRTR